MPDRYGARLTGRIDPDPNPFTSVPPVSGTESYLGTHIALRTLDLSDVLAPGSTGVPIVSMLPTLPDSVNYPQGYVVFLTSDNKLYRSTGSTWTTVVDSNDLAANSVTTNAILAGAVTAAKISVSQLSAIAADLGTITAGVARDAATKFKIDFTNALITVTDNQGAPVVRAKFGKIGGATTDYGLQIWNSAGTLLYDLTGLAANTVDTTQLVNNAVVTAKLADLNVTTAKLNDLAVTTGKIVDAAIATAKLADFAVSSEKMLKSGDNQLENPGFELGSVGWTLVTGTTIVNDGNARTGSFALKYANDGVGGPNVLNANIRVKVEAGDQVFVSCWLKGVSSVGTMRLAVRWRDATETQIGIDSVATLAGPVSSYTQISGFATAPAGAVYAIWDIGENTSDTTANPWYVDDCVMLRAITTGLLVAGAVTASKIAAHTITANEIAALTITAAEIAAATITGGKIAATTITASNIAALTITANEIAATTITAGKLNIATLSAITADVGTLNAGKIQNAGATAGILLSGSLPGGWTTYLDLTAAGASPLLHHSKIDLNADGTATFKGLLDITNAPLSVGFGGAFIVFRDSDVAHGMTSQVPTDVLGIITAASDLNGGWNVVGWAESTSTAASFQGYNVTASSSNPIVRFDGGKKSGTTVAAAATTDLMFSFANFGTQMVDIYGDGLVAIHTLAGSGLEIQQASSPTRRALGVLQGALQSGSTEAMLVDSTWNTAGTPTLIKATVTDTSSPAGSLLMDLQVGGVSKFSVRKDGLVTATTFSGAFSGTLTSSTVSLGDGAVGTPSLTFTSDTNTGLYWIAADRLGITTGGTLALEISASQRLLAVDGAVGTPTYAFQNDADCGLYRITTNEVGLSIAGTRVLRTFALGFDVEANLRAYEGGSTVLKRLPILNDRFDTVTTSATAFSSSNNFTIEAGSFAANGDSLSIFAHGQVNTQIGQIRVRVDGTVVWTSGNITASHLFWMHVIVMRTSTTGYTTIVKWSSGASNAALTIDDLERATGSVTNWTASRIVEIDCMTNVSGGNVVVDTAFGYINAK